MKAYPEQLEIAEIASKYHHGTISAVTGFGKSVAIALIIQKLQVRTLVVVPNLTLKYQLSETFKKLFGSLENITIENIDSTALKTNTNYDCLIIDEAHRSAAKTYRKLNKTAWRGIYYRFAFTGTPFRNRDEEQLLLESVAGQVIYEIDYYKAASRGYISEIEAYFIEVPKIKLKCNPKSWPAVYSELIVNNEARNNMISKLILTLDAAKISTLCLVKEIRHGENLRVSTGAAFMHGEAENNRVLLLEFLLGQRHSLLGTVGVLSEGVDTKRAEFVIIGGLGKSRPQFIQSVGRVIRTSPGKTSGKVIIILDRSHPWCVKHFKEQCKILLETYGVVPLKLEI